jgi:hypothetical protein
MRLDAWYDLISTKKKLLNQNKICLSRDWSYFWPECKEGSYLATFCFCSCAFMLIELDSGHYYESSSSPWPFGFHHCFPWRFSCCLLTSIASRTLIFPWDLKPIHPWFWSMPFTLYQ